MKTFKFSILLIVLGCLLLSPGASAETTSEMLVRAKASTALLHSRRGSATAFCIDPKGIFVTNFHTVQNAGLGNRVNLTLNPSQENEQKLEAVVLTWLEDQDLALLKTISEHEDLPCLQLGETESLIETQRLVALGFPFGGKIKGEEDKGPVISVTSGSVTSLRKKDGVLEVLQVDVDLNPGNSGGPVIQKDGLVVGIVKGGIPGADVNFLIPIEKIKRTLDQPLIYFKPERIKSEDKYRPVSFTAHCFWPRISDERKLECILELEPKGLDPHKVSMQFENGAFHAQVPPIKLPSGPQQFAVEVKFSGGSLRGKVTDFSFKLNEKELWFRDVTQMELDGQEQMCVCTREEILFGKPQGLDAIKVDCGESQFVLDAQKCKHMAVSPTLDTNALTVSAVVMHAGAEIGRVTYGIPFDGHVLRDRKRTTALPYDNESFESILLKSAAVADQPAEQAKTPLKPAEPEKSSVTGMENLLASRSQEPLSLSPLIKDSDSISLPAIPGRVWVGGGGRYFVLYFPETHEISVVDLNRGKIQFSFKVLDPEFQLAVGSSKLILIGPNADIMGRWDLSAGKPEKEASIPFPGRLISVAMGSSSEGPLLALCAEGDAPRETYSLEEMDLDTLRSQRLPWDSSKHKTLAATTELRVSGNGRALGMWNPAAKPTGVGVVRFENNTIKDAYRNEMTSHVLPAFNGQEFCTSVGLFSAQLAGFPKRVAGSRFTLPAHGPGFLLSGTYLTDKTGQYGDRLMDIHICLADNPEVPLATFPALDVVGETDVRSRGMSDFDRVHFISSISTLVYFPVGSKKMEIRKLDVPSRLIAYPEDYLVNLSSPPPKAKAGEVFQYPIVVKSKPRSVFYRLVEAPEGMTISDAGEISWTPSESESGTAHYVTVEISNGSMMKHHYPFKVIVN